MTFLARLYDFRHPPNSTLIIVLVVPTETCKERLPPTASKFFFFSWCWLLIWKTVEGKVTQIFSCCSCLCSQLLKTTNCIDYFFGFELLWLISFFKVYTCIPYVPSINPAPFQFLNAEPLKERALFLPIIRYVVNCVIA